MNDHSDSPNASPYPDVEYGPSPPDAYEEGHGRDAPAMPPGHAGADLEPTFPLLDHFESDDRPMSLGDHLAELRRRLLVCLALALPLLILGLVFHGALWELLILPAREAVVWMGDGADAFERYFELRPTSPTDPLVVIFRLSVFFTVLTILPGLLYQAWLFVAPGLRATERQALRRIFAAGGVLFAAGVMVGWRFGAPAALAFLLAFSADLPAVRNLYAMDAYLAFLRGVALAFGVAFETPLAMWALARAGLLRTRHLRRWWRQVVLGVFALAAVLTPPDPFSQCLLAGILLVLLAAGYGLVHLAQPPEPLPEPEA